MTMPRRCEAGIAQDGPPREQRASQPCSGLHTAQSSARRWDRSPSHAASREPMDPPCFHRYGSLASRLGTPSRARLSEYRRSPRSSPPNYQPGGCPIYGHCFHEGPRERGQSFTPASRGGPRSGRLRGASSRRSGRMIVICFTPSGPPGYASVVSKARESRSANAASSRREPATRAAASLATELISTRCRLSSAPARWAFSVSPIHVPSVTLRQLG